MVTRPRVDELSGNANVVSRQPHATFQHIVHTELLRDPAYVCPLILELERRGPGDNFQGGDPGEQADELLGDSVTEVVIFRTTTHVDERQYGDGVAGILYLLIRESGTSHSDVTVTRLLLRAICRVEQIYDHGNANSSSG